MAEKKVPSLSKFKHDIYTQDYLFRMILPSLTFQQAVHLLGANKKLLREPLEWKEYEKDEKGKRDPRTGHHLKPFWEVFLIHHWQAFIANNVLSILSHQYKWGEYVIYEIMVTLKHLIEEFEKETGVGNPPIFQIQTFQKDEEEYPFLYHQIILAMNYTNASAIDLVVRQPDALLADDHRFFINDNGNISKRVHFEIVQEFDMATEEGRHQFARDLYHDLRLSEKISMELPKTYMTIDDLQFLAEFTRNNKLSTLFNFYVTRDVGRPNRVQTFRKPSDFTRWTRARELVDYYLRMGTVWTIVIERKE